MTVFLYCKFGWFWQIFGLCLDVCILLFWDFPFIVFSAIPMISLLSGGACYCGLVFNFILRFFFWEESLSHDSGKAKVLKTGWEKAILVAEWVFEKERENLLFQGLFLTLLIHSFTENTIARSVVPYDRRMLFCYQSLWVIVLRADASWNVRS